MAEDELTLKQNIFCQEYLVDLNAAQAAIRAGYSEDSAKEIGYENLTKPHVKAKVDELLDLRSRRTEITADKVIAELAKLAFYNIQDFMNEGTDGLSPISAISKDDAAAITEITSRALKSGNDDDDPVIETKVKLADKGQNLERLGKHLKLFTDKQELSGPNGGAVKIVNEWVINPVSTKK